MLDRVVTARMEGVGETDAFFFLRFFFEDEGGEIKRRGKIQAPEHKSQGIEGIHRRLGFTW